MADPTYLVCSVCGTDRFGQARRIYTIKLEDQHLQRNWAVGPTDASEIVCVFCGTLYKWNVELERFEIVDRVLTAEGIEAVRGKGVKR